MKLAAASGVTDMKMLTAWGSSSQPSNAPRRKSGIVAAVKPRTYRRSLRFRPGAANAHIWYSHHGDVTRAPRKRATRIRMSNAEATVVKLRAALRPLACIASTGAASELNTGSKRNHPPTAPSRRPRTIRSTRFRNSRKCCLLYTSDAADDLLCVDLG